MTSSDSSSDSSSEDEEENQRLREAVGSPPSTNPSSDQSKSQTTSSTQKYSMRPSAQLQNEAQNILNTTPELRNFLAKRLTKVLDELIQETNGIANISLLEPPINSTSSGIRLLSGGNLICGDGAEEIAKTKRRRKVSTSSSSENESDLEKLRSAVVTSVDVLNESTSPYVGSIRNARLDDSDAAVGRGHVIIGSDIRKTDVVSKSEPLLEEQELVKTKKKKNKKKKQKENEHISNEKLSNIKALVPKSKIEVDAPITKSTVDEISDKNLELLMNEEEETELKKKKKKHKTEKPRKKVKQHSGIVAITNVPKKRKNNLPVSDMFSGGENFGSGIGVGW